jgi:hypothetical protein
MARCSDYGRAEAMDWAGKQRCRLYFGLAGNAAMDALVAEAASYLRFHHALSR